MTDDKFCDTRVVVIEEFKAPLKLIWALIADLDQIPKFDERFDQIHYLTAQRSGIGTLTHWSSVDKAGKTLDRVEMITEYKPFEYYTYTVLTGAEPKDCTFIFQETPEGTRVIYTAFFKQGPPSDISHYKNAAVVQLSNTRKAAEEILQAGNWLPKD